MGQNDIQATMGLDAMNFKKESDKIVGSVKGMAGEITSALGVGLSVGSTISIVSGLVEKMHNMSLIAERIGLKPEQLQAYNYAAKMTGLELDDIAKAFMKIKQETNKALSGNGDAFWMFKDMGVNISELERLDVDGRFKLIANAMANMTDKTKQEIYAQEIFSKKWQEVLPFIKEYGGLMNEFQDRNLGISGKNFEAADRLAHDFDKLKIAAETIIINSGFIRDLERIASLIDSTSAYMTKHTNTSVIEQGYQSVRSGMLNSIGPEGAVIDVFLRIRDILDARLPGEANSTDRSQ